MTKDDEIDADVPSGAEPWVTRDLIRDTVRTWQVYYRSRLTSADALQIIRNVARLFDAGE